MGISTKSRKIYIDIWVVMYILSVFLFFAPIFISLELIKVVSFGIIFGSFVVSLPEIFFKKDIFSRYRKPVRFIVLITLLTVINSYIIHDQPILLSIRSMMEYLPYSFFFILYRYKVDIKETEKIIRIVTILYSVVFFIALAFAPAVLFDATGGDGEIGINTTRGVARVKVLGVCFAYLSLFISINNWNIKRRLIDIIAVGFFYLIILLNVSRQHILFSLILGVLMITQKVKWAYKIPIILIALFIVNYVIENVEFVQNLISLSEEQIEDEGDENIRIRAFNYYLFDSNHNLYADLTGNGIPNLTGNWGLKFEYDKQLTGFVPSDVGYAKLFFYSGILGFIVFGYLIIKMFRQKIPPNIQYCKYYLMFLVFTNIGSHSFFTDNITFMLIIYILDYSYRSQAVANLKTA